MTHQRKKPHIFRKKKKKSHNSQQRTGNWIPYLVDLLQERHLVVHLTLIKDGLRGHRVPLQGQRAVPQAGQGVAKLKLKNHILTSLPKTR